LGFAKTLSAAEPAATYKRDGMREVEAETAGRSRRARVGGLAVRRS